MPNRSLSDIELRLERDRAALAHSLDILSTTLAPERLKREAVQTADRYGSELGQQAWAAARENPAAFALVGAGFALLLSGTGRRAEVDAFEREAASVSPEAAMEGFDTRVATADAQMRAGGDTSPTPTASRMRSALHSGLDKLSPEARVRVLNAREAAISAQQAVERRAAKLAGQADAIARQNPVVAGAAAFGIGALIAALLPSTRHEDDLLGSHRDVMVNEAQKTLRDEVSRLKGAAEDVFRDAGMERGAESQVPS